jgi:sugar phosphate isomerase/epimerase
MSFSAASINIERFPMSNRRRFLQWVGMGAAGSLAMGQAGFAQTATPASDKAKAGGRGKLPFELGIASYTFWEFPLEKALAMTARVGLKHACLKSNHLPLNATPAQLAKIVDRVRSAGIDLYGVGVIYMKNSAEVDQAFEYAKNVGAKTIVGVPSVELLPLVDEKVKKYNIRVAIHNHGPGDKIYPTPTVAYEKIQSLDPRVGLCIDVGHTVRAGEDLLRVTEKFADRLFDVHIKDVSAASAAGRTIEVGRGVIDIPGFLQTLVKIQFAGVVAFEFEKDPKDPLPGLAESVGYVRGAAAALR